MKAFISRTFREDEKEQYDAADYFEGLVVEAGLEPLRVKPEGGQKVTEQIIAEMRKCVFAIGIFTKRHKIEGKNDWTIPENILSEMALARSLDLKIAGFIQKGVSREHLGLINMEGWQIPEFDPLTMGKKHREFIEYLQGLIPKIPSFSGSYRMDRFEKTVEIYPNGYCIVTHSCRVIIQDENFRRVNHFFQLDANAGKDVKLSSFKDLESSSPASEWELKPFFAFRLTGPQSSRLEAKNVHVQSTNNCTEEQIGFDVILDETPNKDLVVNYEWTIGCHDLFPINKAGLAPGLRKQDKNFCSSSITLGHPGLRDLNFRLVFHHPYEFDTQPYLTVQDNAGNPTYIGASFTLEKSATKDIFISDRINVAPLAAGKVIAGWVPA